MRFHLLGSNLSGGVSYYRELGPWSYAARLMPAMQLITANNAMWDGLVSTDWVMANGCYKEGQINGLADAKYLGTKIWLDYDDAVGNVDWHSPRSHLFDPKDCSKWISEAVALADVVSVSTPAVAEAIKCPRSVVLPNAFDTRMCKMPAEPSNNKTILWRGSDTHTADLAFYDAALENLALKHKDWNFVFIGPVPSFMVRWELPNVTRIMPLMLVDFFRKMAEINPAVMIVPMMDTPFNRCRSNIAWMEGVGCGAATVAPDWDAWAVPGAINYRSNDLSDFMGKVETAMRFHQEAWDHGKTYIQKNLMLHEWAVKRLEILNGNS